MIALLIVTTLLGLGGLGLIVIGVKGFNQRAVQTTGQIVSWTESRIEIGSGTCKTVHFPEVEYRTGDGRVLRHSGLGADEPTALGTPVVLYFDPASPESVSFTGKRGQLGLPNVLIVGGGFLIVSAIAMVALRLAMG